jgi:hypothetical protein
MCIYSEHMYYVVHGVCMGLVHGTHVLCIQYIVLVGACMVILCMAHECMGLTHGCMAHMYRVHVCHCALQVSGAHTWARHTLTVVSPLSALVQNWETGQSDFQ